MGDLIINKGTYVDITNVTLRMPSSLHKRFRAYAEKQGKPLTQLLMKAIEKEYPEMFKGDTDDTDN